MTTLLRPFPWRKWIEALVNLNPKWLTLIIFVVQNTFFLIVFHACSIHASHKSIEYLPSTVVVFTELWKLIFSFLISFIIDGKCSSKIFLDQLVRAFVDDGIDFLKLCLPGLLYAIQNNLQYVIETSPLFMIMYQSKIVTTAVFFTMMLVKKMHRNEWIAIIGLALGVSMVESSQHEVATHHISNAVGMMSVLIACVTSGFAGVYFEKVLKSSKSSIWIINIQLSMMSFSFCSIIAMSENPEEIIRYGLFKGFDLYAWVVIILQAIAGLMIALVVKYSDNIHKGYGASISIVLATSINSVLFHDVNINSTFAMGSLLVFLSSYAYVFFFSNNPGSHLSNVVLLEPSSNMDSRVSLSCESLDP